MNQEVFLATDLVLKAPRNYVESEISPENVLFLSVVIHRMRSHT